MNRYSLSAEASRDLETIWDYLAEHAGINAADTIANAFEATFRRLARRPLLGGFRVDLAPEPFRFWRVHSWMVLYRPARGGVQIARVLHVSRDIAELLGPDA